MFYLFGFAIPKVTSCYTSSHRILGWHRLLSVHFNRPKTTAILRLSIVLRCLTSSGFGAVCSPLTSVHYLLFFVPLSWCFHLHFLALPPKWKSKHYNNPKIISVAVSKNQNPNRSVTEKPSWSSSKLYLYHWSTALCPHPSPHKPAVISTLHFIESVCVKRYGLHPSLCKKTQLYPCSNPCNAHTNS